MDDWTQEEEARRLADRFAQVNRAKFARDNKIPGGTAMIHQHIRGLRPISLEAAIAYAKGFNCRLSEISPRLARRAREAIAGDERARVSPISNHNRVEESCATTAAPALEWPFKSISARRWWLELNDAQRSVAENLVLTYIGSCGQTSAQSARP